MLRRSLTAFIASAALFSIAACGIKGPLKPPPGSTPPPLTGAAPGVVQQDTSLAPGSSGPGEAAKDSKQ
jgi:predicted small lipoprotein YifL